MAHIQKRERNGKLTWRVRYLDPEGTERCQTFARKVDAEAFMHDEMSKVARGEWVDPELGKTTFTEVSALWLGTVAHLKPSTVQSYKSILAKHLKPAFGTRPVASITPTSVKRFTSGMLAEGKSYQTTKNTLNVLRAVLATAVESRYIVANPAAGIRLPKAQAKAANRRRRDAHRYLKPVEVEHVADEMPQAYRSHVLTAAYGGLRAGELAGLKVADVDLEGRRLHVRRSVTEIGSGLVEGTTKNGEPRTVSLPAFLVAELRWHIGSNGLGPADWVWSSPTGERFRHSHYYRRVFLPAVERAEIDKLRFHDLRHTCAALLIAQGAHPKAICERLGHSGIDVTMDVYGHLYDSVDEALADALDAVRSEAVTDRSRTTDGPAIGTGALVRGLAAL